MTITAKMVKELRDKTGLGMMECKKALKETSGDVQAAVDYLREKGLAKAEKKSSRITSEGAVLSYIHGAGKVGVLLEVNCETDFVSKTDDFKGLVKDIAMHIAAMKPEYVSSEDVPGTVLEKERGIFLEQAKNEGKPEHIAEKIVEGRVKKFYTNVCLLNQPFVKDDKKSVGEYVKEAIAKTGENISVRRFTTYVLGEGIEKKQDDLAAEVAKMTGGN